MDSVTQAADYAARLMREGSDPRNAIFAAASRYGVHYSAVAEACGKRGGSKAGKKKSRRTQEREAFDFIK